MAPIIPKKRKLNAHAQGYQRIQPSGDDANVQKGFFANAAGWNLEQPYETKARKGKKKAKETSRLPTKAADGRLKQVPSIADVGHVESDEDWLELGDDGPDAAEAGLDGDGEPRAPEQVRIPERQQILEAKEELAKIATMVNESAEENAAAFKALATIGQSRILAIQKLALATQLAVYKDVIPGYRIRPVSDDHEKLSKDVRRQRTYEQSLVAGYQAYVRELARHAKSGKSQVSAPGKGQSLASVAITCACTLLTSVPHFNFRSELLKIVVGKLSTRRVDDDFGRCLNAIETVFRDDEEGRPAMEATSLLSKMMKAREYKVQESVLNLFLHLRLLSEFSGKASNDRIDQDGQATKKAKHKKEFRNKKDRKQLREQKALQKDMDQAEAIVSHEERDRMQSDTLKMVFATYFRILKVRMPHLMGAVLEGLAKYAHLINQDFFGDLLEALKDLIRNSDAFRAEADGDADGEGEGEEEGGAERDGDERAVDPTHVRNETREALLCTVTAFALLQGQDAHDAAASLHLDLSFFTSHLFQSLLPLSVHADLELGARSLHLPDPDAASPPRPALTTARNKVNLQTTTVLLIRCLTSVLIPPWKVRSVPPLRVAAFTKQLMTASLHMPEKSTQAVLALLADVGGTHGRHIASLWNTEERRGDGSFNPLSDSERSNPFASTVWEGEILRRHFCPRVREGLKIVEKSMADGR